MSDSPNELEALMLRAQLDYFHRSSGGWVGHGTDDNCYQCRMAAEAAAAAIAALPGPLMGTQ